MHKYEYNIIINTLTSNVQDKYIPRLVITESAHILNKYCSASDLGIKRLRA